MSNMSNRVLRVALSAVWLFLLISSLSLKDAHALPSTNSMILLLPDDIAVSDPRVASWIDAAGEEGLKVDIMTDLAFLQLGTNATLYHGFILPDQVHMKASDLLVSALQNYVTAGGNLMLVFDAGALTDTGFYSLTKSRFSALAGTDYVLNDLYPNFVGWGEATGLESTLRQLQVPPGKSMPFTAPVATTTALYLPVSSDNKNGLKGYNHDRQSQLSYHTKHTGKDIFAPSGVVVGPKVKGQKLSFTSRALVADVVHGISGYVFGFLGYPSFVTRGAYTGTVLMTSPNFGLISGLNPYGNGKVLFVNLPLGYLKSLGTDGMPMHGFLRYFGGNILNMPRHSNHPNGQGGLVLNWHMDSAEALPGMQTLKNAGVWGKGPYSIDFTAGPDTVAFGDGLGLNVPGNLLTQSWIKYFDSLGHNVGSHGGWIHDYYGLNVSETNQAGFEQYLVLNKQAMEAVLLHPINEYSAPEGNNPKWAVTWQEQNGILGYYFGGHTGLSATRSWREGQLMNPGIWAFPVTPFGKYATFEEFQQFGISATDVAAWYKSLVDFNLKNNTSRLVYAHPPGASLPQYLPVLKGLLHYVKQTGATWYTMPVLAQFNKDRLLVTWAETDLTGGVKRFEAIHPVSLAKQTWLLPKTGFYKPKIMSGYGYVNEDINNWLVIAGSGTSLIFTAAPY